MLYLDLRCNAGKTPFGLSVDIGREWPLLGNAHILRQMLGMQRANNGRVHLPGLRRRQ